MADKSELTIEKQIANKKEQIENKEKYINTQKALVRKFQKQLEMLEFRKWKESK